MKHMRGERRAGAVSKVGTGQGDDFQEYEDRATVERLIMANNAARFHLTEDTPPMTEPLLSDLGYLADTETAAQILDGTYICPPGTDDYTRDFFRILQRPQNVDALDRIDTSFSVSDFQNYWKKAKEQTSSSISTLHFGHDKAVCKNDTLSEMHCVFVDIAVNSDFSPKRWQRGLTVMLKKKQGVILVNKLHAILLMEADFNYANKTIFGQRMMLFADDRGLVAEECLGNHSFHDATEVALNHQLFCDITRQKCYSAAIGCVDLEQCFDCIAHSIASLCAQQWGVPIQAIVCLLTTIQLMVFFLHTAHDDSDVFYSAVTDSEARESGNTHPYQGSCQGNGGGPALFSGTSSRCVGYMHQKGFAACMRLAFSSTVFCIIGILYVDNTDLFVFAEYPRESVEWVTCRMQDMMTHWRGCLQVTGRNEKCNGTPIGIYWDDEGRWHYRTNIASLVLIPDATGAMQAIERLKPSQATTVVGVVQAADGNMDEQVQVLKEIADDIGTQINKGYLPRTLVWQSLCTQVWPLIRFPLAATTISAEESESITKVLYSQLLPSGGANCHFPLVYRHAPFTFFGLTLPQVTDTQFIEQVKRVLVHRALPTHTSIYFNISLEQAQLEVGIGSPLLEANYDDYGFLLTFCWVKVLWQFLWMH
jgi:hypothetical protein